MNQLNKYENILPERKSINNNKFWNEFFFKIGNGESLRGASKDLGIPFQTVWSAIMSDEKRRATYADAKMSRAHYHASKIEEILEDVESGKIKPSAAKVSIDARKWITWKIYPMFFSNRVHHQHYMSVDGRKQHAEELRELSQKRSD